MTSEDRKAIPLAYAHIRTTWFNENRTIPDICQGHMDSLSSLQVPHINATSFPPCTITEVKSHVQKSSRTSEHSL